MAESTTARTRDRIIEAITAPLGFFVLALLIVESFLAAALVGAQLEPSTQLTAIWLGVGMFALVTAGVFILVWHKPENLTFDKQAHLDRGRGTFGTDSKTVLNRDALLPSGPESMSKT